MGQYRHPYNDEVREATGPLARFLSNKGWTEVVPVEVVEEHAEAVAGELKGKALEAELERLGLPKSGSADEKRAAIAEKLAADDLANGGFVAVEDLPLISGPDGPPEYVEPPTGSPDPSQDQQPNHDAPEEQS